MRALSLHFAAGLLGAGLFVLPALADSGPAPVTPPPMTPMPVTPGPGAPAADTPAKADAGPDVWIFSGVLPGNKESFSGTLVSDKSNAQFELKMSNGATCDGGDLKGDIGLVRLSEIPCTDGRSMRALFVPQAGKLLKVFGHIGDERFSSEAHLLGTEPAPEQKQTAQPTVPQVQPPPGGGSRSEPPSSPEAVPAPK